jgi:hypothetical protein
MGLNRKIIFLLFFVGSICFLNQKCTFTSWILSFTVGVLLGCLMWFLLYNYVPELAKGNSTTNVTEIYGVAALAALWNCFWLSGITKKYRYCLILYFFSVLSVAWLTPGLPE